MRLRSDQLGVRLQSGQLGVRLQSGQLGVRLQSGQLGVRLQSGQLGVRLQSGQLGVRLQSGQLGVRLQSGQLGVRLQSGQLGVRLQSGQLGVRLQSGQLGVRLQSGQLGVRLQSGQLGQSSEDNEDKYMQEYLRVPTSLSCVYSSKSVFVCFFRLTSVVWDLFFVQIVKCLHSQVLELKMGSTPLDEQPNQQQQKPHPTRRLGIISHRPIHACSCIPFRPVCCIHLSCDSHTTTTLK